MQSFNDHVHLKISRKTRSAAEPSSSQLVAYQRFGTPPSRPTPSLEVPLASPARGQKPRPCKGLQPVHPVVV